MAQKAVKKRAQAQNTDSKPGRTRGVLKRMNRKNVSGTDPEDSSFEDFKIKLDIVKGMADRAQMELFESDSPIFLIPLLVEVKNLLGDPLFSDNSSLKIIKETFLGENRSNEDIDPRRVLELVKKVRLTDERLARSRLLGRGDNSGQSYSASLITEISNTNIRLNQIKEIISRGIDLIGNRRGSGMNQRNLFFDKTSPQYSDFAPELGALLHRLDFPLRNIEEVLNKIFSGLDRSASSVANSSRSGSSRKTRIRKKVPKKKVVAKRALRKAA